MTNTEKYIEFGSHYDRVWVVDLALEGHLDKALRVRGYGNVSPGLGLCAPRSVWEDTKYLPPDDSTDMPRVPGEVFFINCRTHPLRQSKPFAASASRSVADKVTEAMGLTYPEWEYEVVTKGRPE